MKASLLLVSCTLAAISLKAQTQSGVTEMKVTDELRKRFALEAHEPGPSEISYETPPELLKRTNITLGDPDPSQVSYETPPALRKRTLSAEPPAASTEQPKK